MALPRRSSNAGRSNSTPVPPRQSRADSGSSPSIAPQPSPTLMGNHSSPSFVPRSRSSSRAGLSLSRRSSNTTLAVDTSAVDPYIDPHSDVLDSASPSSSAVDASPIRAASYPAIGLGIGIESAPLPSSSHLQNHRSSTTSPRPYSFSLSVPPSPNPDYSSEHSARNQTSGILPSPRLSDQPRSSKIWKGGNMTFSSATLSPRLSPYSSSACSPENEKRSWGWIKSSPKSPYLDEPSSPRHTKSKHIRSTTCNPILRVLLGPFAVFLLPSDPIPKKRSPLLWRLISASYIIFCLIYFTSQVPYYTNYVLDPNGALSTRRLLSRDSTQLFLSPPSFTLRGAGLVGRPWTNGDVATNPLSQFRHTSRFGKLFSKLPFAITDDIEPYAFAAEDRTGLVTACLYVNEAWISELPSFVRLWNGPVSLVFEDPNPRQSKSRSGVLSRLANLRSMDPLIKQYVDFHIVSSLPSRDRNRTRELLISDPRATNFHLNIARFFARTEMVWMLGDPRVFPSRTLRARLESPEIRMAVMNHGDAVVVPTFAQLRGPEKAELATIRNIKRELGLEEGKGISEEDFVRVGYAVASVQRDTLPIAESEWPTDKAALCSFVSRSAETSTCTSDDINQQVIASEGVFALYDHSFPVNKGPTNWNVWKSDADDPQLLGRPADSDQGLGFDGISDGNESPYLIEDMDMNYAPNFVQSRAVHPWCTERFGKNKAACAYQVYMAGAEFWVLNDDWAWTVEPIEAAADPIPDDEALKLSIDKRMYIKYHQEVCVHYSRQLIYLGRWDDERARHVKKLCRRTLQQYNLNAKSV